MIENFKHIMMSISLIHLNILFLLGLALFGGTVGGRMFQKLKIPQVVGYITIGILVGQSGLKIVDGQVLQMMEPFNYFALGLIGFMIGGELKKEVFAKYGKQFLTILLSEGLFAFFLVFALTGLLGSFFFGGGPFFWGLGLLLGAIASATAPAATTDVLWENKSRGPLTTTVLGIVAMDDALALLLFAVASSVAANILGRASEGVLRSVIHPIYEMGASATVGIVSGLVLSTLLKRQTEKDKMLALSVGTVLLVLGFSLAFKIDMLLAAMILGATVVNRIPRISKDVFSVVSGFTPPIYVLFFVLVGAKLNIANMTPVVIFVTAIYLISRTAGKMAGASFGARISGAPASVRRYLPFCLFSQAGVAIGLSIAAFQIFPGDIGNYIVVIITASTFVVQLLGPPSTKFAILRSGEAGLNVTEEDLIRKAVAGDIMDKNPPIIYHDMQLTEVLDIFRKNAYLYYPVVNRQNKLAGIITVESIRNTFMETESRQLLLAHDLMEPIAAKAVAQTPMKEVGELLDRYRIDCLPVVTGGDIIEGFIERRMFNKFISTKMMEVERKVESLE